jgi:hypothetical protein
MIRFRRCLLLVLLVAAVNNFSRARAQEFQPAATGAADKEQIEAALKLTKEAAVKYEFVVGESGAASPVLLAEPVLKWSNPSVGQIHGNVFLWTVGGRPAVVSSIFKWFSPHTHMSHEFHSLSEQPVRARFEGKEVWVSSEPGLTFSPLPEAPAPAAGKPQRLLQMREFAKACAATKRERDGNLTELRLLTQPVHRYAALEDGLIDGAIFTMVQGTDPELFLLLEARDFRGKQQWHLAATRMNSVAFDLRYKDKSIWSVDVMPWPDVSSHRKPYTSFMHRMP